MSKRPSDSKLPPTGGLCKKAKVSGNETDTDDELQKARSRPLGPMDFFVKNHTTQQHDRVNYVEENVSDFSPNKRPTGVLALRMKVQATKEKMDSASREEDFVSAQKYKDEYESYYAAAQREVRLYHYCTWLVEHASNKIEGYKASQKFEKAGKWKERRDIASAYLTLVPVDDVRHLLNKLETTEKAITFDPFADIIAEGTSDGAISSTTTAAEENVIAIDDDDDDVMEEEEDDEAMVMEEEEEEEEEVEEEAVNNDGAINGRATKPKAKQARKRKAKQYTPVAATTTTTAVVKNTKNPLDKPPSDAAYYAFINKPSHTVKLQGKPPRTFVPKNQGYTLASHYLYCTICKNRIAWNNRGPHAISGKHESALAAANLLKADLEKSRKKVQARIDDEGLVGSTYSDDKIDAQLLWLQVACRGNWSLKSIEDNRSNLSSISSYAIPGCRELADRVTDLKNLHMDKIKSLVKECFPEYSIIMDGTPVFAEAECLMIRLVHRKTFKIHQFVLHLQLYAEALDGATIAAHVKEAIEGEINCADEDKNPHGLVMRNLRATAIDRAGTNKTAMDTLHEDEGVKSFEAYCMPHGISGCGKKREMSVGETVLHSLGGMSKYSLCKARSLHGLLFGEAPKRRDGPRWWKEHEQCAQVDGIGLDRLKDEYAEVCYKNGWSKKSSKKFLNAIEDPQDFAIASVEIAAVTDVGHPLCSETYTCESDQPMVLSAHESIERLRGLYGHGLEGFAQGNGFKRLERRAYEAATIMEGVVRPLDDAIDAANAEWNDAKLAVTAAQSAVDEFVAANSTTATSARSRRDNTRRDYRALAGNTASDVPTNQALDTALEDAQNEAVEKEKAHQEAVAEKEKFLDENYISYDDFFDLGMETVKPIIKDYKRLFVSPDGDYAAFVKGCIGARALYYFAAKDMTLAVVQDCLRDLFEAFDFDEFRNASGLLNDCFGEIPKYLAKLHSTPESFWSEVEGAEEYDKTLEKKKQKDPENYGNRTWRDDRIESTRRAWEWWRSYHTHFAYLSKVARLVALIPITSAAVERCFSQVKFIIETCGENGLQETLEVRLMERVNKYA